MEYNFLSVAIVYFYLISSSFFVYSNAGDVLGCGGYVRSEVEIDFSQVRVKLLTQQGNLKFETECAPNNGYYFIRLYDKGEYILKVSPPSGWSFKPEEVLLKVDGETDPCSLSQDINFFFEGFAVVGRVVSLGSDSGPEGVTVALNQGEKQVLQTVTGENGAYVFSPLAAGKYEVFASHPTWSLIINKVSVIISGRNGDAGSSLVVAGYALTGAINVKGKLAESVKIIVHNHKEIKHKIADCKKEKLPSYKSTLKYPVLCTISCDSNGLFKFSNLPLGKYTVVPHLVSSDIKFDVGPTSIDVNIGHQDFRISEVFTVKGRSLLGMVLMGKTSSGIAGAKVTLDGGLETTTDDRGRFVFHGTSFGDHSLKVIADSVEFDAVKTKLSLDEDPLPPLVPSRYQTCFSVSVDASSDDLNIPWLISVIGSGSQHEVQTGPGGTGCLFLQPGEYKASIVLTPQDEEAGIRFGPKEHSFTIHSQPIKNLSFSQFLGEINGIISCLETCKSLTVSLRPTRGSSVSPRTTTSSQGRFTFTEVIPGEYLLSVDKEEWCWKDQTVPVSVNAKTVSAKFEQTGFRLTLNASHKTTLNYATNKGHSGNLEVQEGTSRQCVSAPGKYVLTPTSCHRFKDSTPLAWDTSAPELVSLKATHHQVTGTIVSNEQGPFSVTVRSGSIPEVGGLVLGPLQPSTTDKNSFIFETWLQEGEVATFVPSSSSNLFQYTPTSFTVTVQNECLFGVVEFHAERALFLKGYIKPPIKGVTIKVTSSSQTGDLGENSEGPSSDPWGASEGQTDDRELTYTSNAEGFFIAGPLDKSREYLVTAEKVGYVIKPSSQKVDKLGPASEIVKMTFEAYKLAEIIVNIVDEEHQPLGGVLVSTSGGKSYRQNSLTDAEGTFVFQSLMPSDYFIKPIMKEYEFQPPSKMVEVQGGATVTVNISAVRVAYSMFGQTVSLSGDPEAEVVVEATGTEAACRDLQEEALSDSRGNFRIRGLTPNCEYKLALKSGEGVNQHIDRALSKEKLIQIKSEDFFGLKIVLLRPFLQLDVAIIVDTDPRYLSTLTAELYREDDPDSPVHIVSLGNHPFFMLPPMIMDQKTYFIQLVSSLPQSQFIFSSPSVSFTANSSFVRLSIPFKPTYRNTDAEISRGTIFGLIFFVFLVSVILNYNKIQPLVLTGLEMYQNHLNARNAGNNGAVEKPVAQIQIPQDTAYIEPVNVKKRVKVRKT